MNENRPSWLRLLPLGLFLLLLTGAALASLAVINIRQDKARLAAATYKLHNEFAETSRHLQEMTASVAAAIQPATLRARVGTTLAPMVDKNIVWVRPGTVPAFESRPLAALPTARFAFAEPASTHLSQ